MIVERYDACGLLRSVKTRRRFEIERLELRATTGSMFLKTCLLRRRKNREIMGNCAQDELRHAICMACLRSSSAHVSIISRRFSVQKRKSQSRKVTGN